MVTSVLPRPSPRPPGPPAEPHLAAWWAWAFTGASGFREPHRAAGLVEFTLSSPSTGVASQ